MATTDQFSELYSCFEQYPTLLTTLSLTNIVNFVIYSSALKDDILLTQAAKHDPSTPPLYLPETVYTFLHKVIGAPQDSDAVSQCWTVLKNLIWSTSIAARLSKSLVVGFKEYGHGSGLTLHTFYPPSPFCTNAVCSNYKKTPLKSAQQREVVFFTHAEGPMPAHHVHLYCSSCRTSYRHGYHVRDNRRHYPAGVPSVIHAGEHQFVEQRLVKTWILDMVNACKSATNCARTYNGTFAEDYLDVDSSSSVEDSDPEQITDGSDFHFSPILTHKHVWDAVILVCLLEDCAVQGTVLDLLHTGTQDERLRQAMGARNIRIHRFGLGQTLHRCRRCTRFYDTRSEGGGISRVRVIVIDGVTVGHPCCASHACSNTLEKTTHRFCRPHEYLDAFCSVVGCQSPALTGHLTCGDTAHLQAEARHLLHGQSRVRRPILEAAADSDLSSNEAPFLSFNGEELFDMNDANNTVVQEDIGPAAHPNGPAMGHKRIRAQFGRKRSHNEQLIVAPCGVIIARETFFGAEAVSAVKEYIQKVYSLVPPPEHIFFDNNCQLARIVRPNCPFFDKVGLSVDVFHFDCKHSKADEYCQLHCNPRSFPELRREDGTWFFNSSAAEQTNSWIRGYQNTCREMTREKFEFFLDEMIMRRNKATIRRLDHNGSIPTYWTLEELRGA